jgi:molecular chaperone GrpE
MNEENNRPEEVENEHVEAAENTEETTSEFTVENQIKELNDKYVRLYSEFDNYRKRTNKEKIEIIANANARLLENLIPTLDDFERAIENNQTADDVQALKEGFELIFSKFRNVLESQGLKQMVAKGQPFDSEFHEAIANIPAPEEALKGCVVDDVEKGYLLNDKVIRYAKVVVGQ